VERFIKNWFGNEPALSEQMLADLDKPENEGILELTQNPLLLTLLCIAYEETLAFPARRVEVYEDAIDALLRKWDTSRRIKRDEIYRKLSLGRKRQMLARISYETFRQGEYFIPQRKLEKMIVDYLARVPEAPDEVDIDGEAVLKAIAAQHGLLVERSQRIYSFSHLTFQEYFTAKYIVDNEARGALDELMQHVFDDRWQEVFLLVASMLDNADEFFEKFLHILDSYAAENNLIPILKLAEAKRIELQEVNISYSKKIGTKPTLYRPSACRGGMLSLILNNDFEDPYTRFIGLSRKLILNGFLSFDRDMNLDFALVSIPDMDFLRPGDLHFNFDCFDFFNIRYTLDCFLNLISKLAIDVDVYPLGAALTSLERPDNSAAEWDKFTENFKQILFDYRPSALILYRFKSELAEESKKHWWHHDILDALLTHLKGVNILIHALDIAYVSDRRAIEDRLLLPPEAPLNPPAS